MRSIQCVLAAIILCISTVSAQTVWLDDLDLSSMDIGWASPQARRSVDGNPLRIAGTSFARGVGTHAVSTYLMNLNGTGRTFTASVGVDDESGEKASVEFLVLGDRKILWRSGVMKKDQPAISCAVDCRGVKLLGLLVTDGGDNINWDHADWAEAKLELVSARPASELLTVPAGVSTVPYVLTPKPQDAPRITGARVFGVRPGNPFLFTVTATGMRPMKFNASGLPSGLTLDETTGRITGKLTSDGSYHVTLKVSNEIGETSRVLRIEVGDRIALTPPMGWNSWNCWACAVDDQKVRASADAMVASGLVNHGWTYLNIDDCWEIKPDATDDLVKGDPRDSAGRINTNKKFPDMKALADYVHAKELKIGIYSSPGPLTCAGYTASYQHEQLDAQQYADWEIDYLKYDWCSYGRIAKDRSLEELQKPYRIMRDALDRVPRDIIYSLCQYGMGDVWTWGADVGGNCWRTTGDIIDTWSSMAGIGFGQAGHEAFAGPGRWNDPDMLVVGLVGWGPSLHPSRLKPDEQYTHISLWCLLASPLLIGCDLARLDVFTLNLLTNDEVLEVNQDPLGNQARRIMNEGGKQVWMKEMEDGSKAVGLFYVGAERKTPEEMFDWAGVGPTTITVTAKQLGVEGEMKIRDLWRQNDLGVFRDSFTAEVPYHGVVLVRVTKASQ